MIKNEALNTSSVCSKDKKRSERSNTTLWTST
jgi:hypothetical protein